MQHYKIGIRVYAEDRAFERADKSIDFLIDGDLIKKEDVLFCIERPISREYLQGFKDRGYDYVEVWKPKIWSRHWWFFRHGFRGWKWSYTWKMWADFFDEYSLDHYVVYNDFNELHRARNLVMNTYCVTTWFYQHSTDYWYVHGVNKNDLYTNLHYDKFVCWGGVDQYLKMFDGNRIGEYVKLGCLWSENVKEREEI